ncbi:hypothetical protein Sru01_46830 [Sphaerisporangium rufum]|uniref:Uncharacterized protein n=1 Tax=Sphaerisporangium rufum TaxID=1381558 RepID=A0A919R4T3_9ACTN|nr:hypothetical protein [Sphaerisporangium rufum]GII79701.1 hypothetical protein Sru01_46830 [Sphaerisporangium rufum]
MSPLEAAYRRLLAVYPRDHRARHEEEMIGVLMAGARPGQLRPHFLDVTDLLWGASRVHARRAFGPGSAGAWRAGLTVAMALWPLLMLAAALAMTLMMVVDLVASPASVGVVPSREPIVALLGLVEPVIVAAPPALAVLLGRRWIAVLGALALACHLVLPWYGSGVVALSLDGVAIVLPDFRLPTTGWFFTAQVVAAVIAFLPAARRALALVPRRGFLRWTPLALAGLIAGHAMVRLAGVIDHQIIIWKPVPWLVVVGLAAGFACRSASGRRAALVLFLPAAALGDLGNPPWTPAVVVFAQLGCAVLAFAAAVSTRRRGGRRVAEVTPGR